MGVWSSIRARFVGRPEAQFDGEIVPVDRMFASLYRTVGSTPLGRLEALSVPAVQRGRNLLCSISTLPLVQIAPDGTPVDNPLFRQLDPDVPNVVTLAQTVEDLLMESIAWWLITERDFAGYPTSVRRIDPLSVSLVPPSRTEIPRTPALLPSGMDPRQATVWIDGQPVEATRVIRFDSPNPGVLHHCGRTIRRAIALEKAATLYAEDPRPLDYFTPADGADPIDDDDVPGVLSQWKAARKARATAWVPASMVYNSVSSPSPAELQLVELQKQAWLEIAQLLGVDAEDLGVSTTSRTYQNDVDRRMAMINDVKAPYMRAITDRLSMGDVTRRGHCVDFDLTAYLRPDPTTRVQYYSGLKALGAITPEEIRMAEKLGPMPADDTAPSAEPSDAEASGVPSTFDSDKPITFADVELVTFSVDKESRTIEGLALPYDKVAAKGGAKFSFAPGSLQWSDPSRVKLLRDHDPTQPLGKATALSETPAGLQMKFSVARGPEGDRALELAEDGVLDGLSVGVDFNKFAADPKDKTVHRVTSADLREVSLVAVPAFDDARVTRVAASAFTEGNQMPETPTVEAPAEQTPAVQTFTAEQVAQMFAALPTPAAADAPAVVDPTRPTAVTAVTEALPYRFDRGGNFVATENIFSADLHEMALANDSYGTKTDAGKRVMGLLDATFSTASTDVSSLNPLLQRPDMYVDQKDYRTPLSSAINKGAPPNGIQPFAFPKFNSSTFNSGSPFKVGDHTEGTEPTPGALTTTSQTVTPSPISGKAQLTREVWDMGGNPAVSTLIWNQMVRGYREGLEVASATFLNSISGATTIAIPAGTVDGALAAAWDAALADLQFIRTYDFEYLALCKALYKGFVAAKDTTGRPLYSQVAPMNANGTSSTRFTQIDLAGVTGIPAWTLAQAEDATSVNSWLFDPSTVHLWTTAPMRLDFPGASDDNDTYQPVAKVQIALWGYKAFANSDLGGVRQVTYAKTGS